MSRFYNIVVGAETASGPTRVVDGTMPAASNNNGATWTNLVGGKAVLGAQQIELDVPVSNFDTPLQGAYVRIWGPSKEQISQASDFNGAPISVYAGMQNGLPLATAAAPQAGLIVKGTIYNAYGNWQGTNQTLEFIIISDGGATQSQPANLSFIWKKGQKLGDVVTQVLQAAYPGKKVSVNISPNLVLGHDESGVYQTIQQFASYVKGVSQDIMGGDYQGVSITMQDDTFIIVDGTNANPLQGIQILEQDLIGQVTWLDAYTISFSTVMRSDIKMNQLVMLPTLAGLQAVTGQQSASNARAKNTFQGTWMVNVIRHVGNSRAPDAQSWITNFQAFSTTAPPADVSVSDTSA